MVRAYDPHRPVPPAVRDALIAAALRAPSAGSTRGSGFLVLDDDADRGLFWRVTTDPDGPADRWLRGMRTAPLLIVCFSNRQAYIDRYTAADKNDPDLEGRWPVPYWHIDAGFAALLILLSAVDRRLGACFFGVPARKVDALRRAFAVPAGNVPVGVVSVGYPAPNHRGPPPPRTRRTDGMVHYGRWANPQA